MPSGTASIENVLSSLETYLKQPLSQTSSEDQFVQLVDQFDRTLSDPQTITYLQSHPELIERIRMVNTNIQSVYANTMSAMTAELYNQLKFNDYKNMTTDDIAKDCQSLIDLTLYQNELVRNHILSIENKEQRNLVFERYIFLAKQLLDNRDFSGAKAIYDALNFTEIRRLGADSVSSDTQVQSYQWQGLSPAALEAMRYMETLFGQDLASKEKLRALAEDSKKPSLIGINKVTQIIEMDFKAQCDPHVLEKINLEDILKLLDQIVATNDQAKITQLRELTCRVF